MDTPNLLDIALADKPDLKRLTIFSYSSGWIDLIPFGDFKIYTRMYSFIFTIQHEVFMRNRAKCKSCNDVLESYHRGDYVECKCGEISISGGNETYECYARDWENFVRVDDEDNEIMVRIEEDVKPLYNGDDNDLMRIVDEMIRIVEDLPSHALTEPITHYDYLSLLMVIRKMAKMLDDKKNET